MSVSRAAWFVEISLTVRILSEVILVSAILVMKELTERIAKVSFEDYLLFKLLSAKNFPLSRVYFFHNWLLPGATS